MQRDAHLDALRHRTVILPADIGEHLAAVLVDMQRGVLVRIVGEHRDGVDAFRALRQGDRVAGRHAPALGQLDHLLQADLRIGHAARRVPHVLGVAAGGRHGRVLHRPGHHLPVRLVQLAGQRGGFRHLVPHRRREAVPHIGEALAPVTGPGHAAEQHEQQQQRAPETEHRMQLPP
ncbi:hypothetical protein D9M71_204830 [compost metagenome]